MKYFVASAIVLGLLVGCASNKPKTITFETDGFMKVYMADRDAVIRKTAPAVNKCLTVTDTSPLDQRRKCDEVKALLTEWQRRDAIVYTALMTGATVTTVDWEKAAEIAGKLIGAAAGVAL